MRIHGLFLGAVTSLCFLSGFTERASSQEAPPVSLAAHRAVYDIALDDKVDNKGVEALNGRFVTELTGNTCEGFTVRDRMSFSIQIDAKLVVLDVASKTYESPDGKSFWFQKTTRVNGAIVKKVFGEAVLGDDKQLHIRINEPDAKQASSKGDVFFPTSLIIEVLRAAQSSKPMLNATTYQASGEGDKVEDSLAIIGHRIVPNSGEELDKVVRVQELTKLSRWPVKMSFFERKGTGDQTPENTVFFEIYENGVWGSMTIRFPEFSMKANLKEIEFLPSARCEK